MSFFQRQEIGRIYMLKMVLPDDTVVHKIGMTHSDRAVDRMMEILRSWFVNYRFVPYTELRLDMKSQEAAKLEQHIHQILRPVQFEPNYKVDGGTEMFCDLVESRVIHYLRAHEQSPYPEPPKMSQDERNIICRLLTR